MPTRHALPRTGRAPDGPLGHAPSGPPRHGHGGPPGHGHGGPPGHALSGPPGHAPGGPPIEAVLRGLPAPNREILVETFFRGRTPRQAARRLGLTEADARARLYRAVEQLAVATAQLEPRRAAAHELARTAAP